MKNKINYFVSDFIDFHNHILPDVDDGPDTLEESIKMLDFACSSGINKIFNTFHNQHPKMDGKDVSYKYLNSKLNEITLELEKRNIDIQIDLGAEVYYLPNLVDILEEPFILIGNKRYMLIEFSRNIFPDRYEEQFFDLQLNGVTPIIAHPERYKFLQNDINLAEDWVEKGFILQIDAGSILGYFGKNCKKSASELLNRGLCHIIGSDAHDNNRRNFCIHEVYKYLNNSNKFSSHILNNNCYKLVTGAAPSNIERFYFSRKKEKLFTKLISKFARKD